MTKTVLHTKRGKQPGGIVPRICHPKILRSADRRLVFGVFLAFLMLALSVPPGVPVATADAAEISGAKWRDLDADGERDSGEPGLENWKIYLDENRNGRFDSGEPFRLTAADGTYTFTGLGGGRYVVREVVQEGWEQTYPGAATTAVASRVQLARQLA